MQMWIITISARRLLPSPFGNPAFTGLYYDICQFFFLFSSSSSGAVFGKCYKKISFRYVFLCSVCIASSCWLSHVHKNGTHLLWWMKQFIKMVNEMMPFNSSISYDDIVSENVWLVRHNVYTQRERFIHSFTYLHYLHTHSLTLILPTNFKRIWACI